MKCDYCDKDATKNLQNRWVLYNVKNENYSEQDSWEGDSNEHFCDECYNTKVIQHNN